VGCSPLEPSITSILNQPVKADQLTIHPKFGWLYMREKAYERILNQAFGNKWELRPTSPWYKTPSDAVLFRFFALFVNNKFISEACGEQELAMTTGRVNAERRVRYAALVRVCKELGVATELWDKPVVDAIRMKNFEMTENVWKEKAQH
ncbi:mitochondrial genome maintenance MGM101, partial [Blyttiomyces helicus]